MIHVHSRARPDVLLAIIYRRGDMQSQETAGVDITPEREFLQVRSLRAPGQRVYAAHKHLPQTRTTTATQECLIVMQGEIDARLYDLDDVLVDTFTIGAGDCLILLGGGHAFTVLADDTQFYELKNGPYNGLAKDKAPVAGMHV